MSRFASMFCFSALCALTISNLKAESKKPESSTQCISEKASTPVRLGLRYTTPEGIGYKEGYTTIEGLFSRNYHDQWFPLLDLRAHIFDDGKFAGNAGLGARYLASSRIWGANVYYDYRNTHHQHYNQVALGLESLGVIWDFRLNGYLPVGAKESKYRVPHFDGFQDNYMYVDAFRDFALKGVNLEAGYHYEHFKSIPLYFAGGPYYLTGTGTTAWGGELRGRVEFFQRYIRVEANTTYDHFFQWRGQAQISVNIPLGRRRKIHDRNKPCPNERALYTRLMQSVDRNEIIPVGKEHNKSVAIDPATGQPYYFIFVDNTSSSLGTYESPYSSLATAQANSSPGQVVYVFPGDGTATNMDQGITLQDDQMLLGASTTHPISTTLGEVSIPVFASTLPVITNTTTAPVVTLANNNTVSGFYIENNTSAGIEGTNITNLIATENTIIGGLGGPGILLNDVSGQVAINNNLFAQRDLMSSRNYAVHIVQTTAQCDASFINDTFLCMPTSNFLTAIFADLSNTGSIDTLSIANTTFFNSICEGGAVNVSLQNSSYMNNLIISDSQATNFYYGLELDIYGSGSLQNVELTNTSLSNAPNGYVGVYVDMENTGSIGNITLTDCTLSNTGSYGFVTYQGSSGSIDNITITGCDLSNNNSGYGISLELASSGSIGSFNISDSTLNRNTGGLGAINANLSGTGSISNFGVSGCTIDNNVNTSNSGYGIYIDLENAGTVDNITVTDSIITNHNNGGAIFLLMNGSASISNVKVSNTTMDIGFNGNGIAIQMLDVNAGSIRNIAVSDSTLSNFANGILLNVNGGGSIDNVSVSGSNLNDNDGFALSANLTSTGTITNLDIESSNFNNNSYGISVDLESTGSLTNWTIANSRILNTGNNGIQATLNSTGTIQNLMVSNTTVNGNGNGLYTTATGGIDSAKITGSNFSGSRNGGILFNNASLSDLLIADTIFIANPVGVELDLTVSSPSIEITGSTFRFNAGSGLLVGANSASVMSITNNSFTGTVSPNTGYGAQILNNSGSTICLNFAQNSAIPVNLGGIDPYYFNNISGTFNTTADSVQTNNIGTISTSGTIGTCTQ